MDATDNRFLLGVNYWPRRKAMYWWSDFDAEEVRDEFAVIAGLGLDVVRLFLLWDDFQPAPDTVSRACLDHLTTVCDAAAHGKLGLDVTFFTGHMSGPNWSPRWLLNGNAVPGGRLVVSGGKVVSRGYRNPYTDPEALAAQRLHLTEVVRRLKDHPAIWAWNLGNEPDLFAEPPDAATGRQWVEEMVRTIKEIDDRHPVTCGLHIASLQRNNGLRIDDVFGATGAFLWCYADYAPELWDRPPCAETHSKHERHFGLVRPDGSLKPHAEALRRFATTRPTRHWPPRRVVPNPPTPDEFYAGPRERCIRLYDAYLAGSAC